MIDSTDIIPSSFRQCLRTEYASGFGLDLFYIRTELVQRLLLDVADLNMDLERSATLADYWTTRHLWGK
jgi:hypothetical protein